MQDITRIVHIPGLESCNIYLWESFQDKVHENTIPTLNEVNIPLVMVSTTPDEIQCRSHRDEMSKVEGRSFRFLNIQIHAFLILKT